MNSSSLDVFGPGCEFEHNICIVDAVFRAKTQIRSLPKFHAARWSAWLRFACKKYHFPLGNILLGLFPLRNGARPIQTNELVPLRLITSDICLTHLDSIVQIMTSMESCGNFSSETFDFVLWRDAIGGGHYALDAPLHDIGRLSMQTVASEIAALAAAQLWTLHFYTPLRLKKPAGSGKSRSEIYNFCRPGFFSSSAAILHLCKKVRFLKDCGEWFDCNANLPAILSNELVWLDMRYNETRHIALGGIMGKIICAGPMDKAIAQRLVLGQYLGAGKNPLFGLGYWLIPEIGRARKIDFKLNKDIL